MSKIENVDRRLMVIEALKAKLFTQKDLAERLGISQAAVSQHLRGLKDLSASNAEKLYRAANELSDGRYKKRFTPVLKAAKVKVVYDMDKTQLNKNVVVMHEINETTYGIEFNRSNVQGVNNGAIILVDDAITPCEGDNVAVIGKDKIKFGDLRCLTKGTQNFWFILNKENNALEEITDDEEVKFVVGLHFPRGAKRKEFSR